MKKMKTISKLAASAAIAVASVVTGFAQNNLGASCGCPPVSARPVKDLSGFPHVSIGGTTTTNPPANEFSGNVHLTCDTLWRLSSKYYVTKGHNITLDPGTALQGVFNPDPIQSAVLLIERGGQIIANGTADCPIVMTTDQDPLDGTYSLTNVGKWGGLVICGIASNSVVSPTNDGGLGIAGKSGMGHCEGWLANAPGILFGANAADPDFPAFNDNDNSGSLRYVSVRHPGAIVGGAGSGNEINGISLYSVGRGTILDHVEVVASADDDIEYFGGTVNTKYISTLFGDDDKYDYDLGYGGKSQFYFSIAADSLNTGDLQTSDNGIEADADDQFAATATSNHSYPVFYNQTFISNGKVTATVDNTGHAGYQAKELTGGNVYNSIFANFRSGLHLAEARSTALHKGDAYDQWTNNAADPYLVANGGVAQPNVLKFKNNVILVNNSDGRKRYCFTRGVLVATNSGDSYIKNPPTMVTPGIPTAADSLQFLTTDGNQCVYSNAGGIPGIDYSFGFNGTNSAFTTDLPHATPLTNLTSSITPPNDGFFSIVNFKGAFDANNQNSNYLSGWAQNQITSFVGAGSNPTDVNRDGVTDVNDYLQVIGKFGQKK